MYELYGDSEAETIWSIKGRHWYREGSGQFFVNLAELGFLGNQHCSSHRTGSWNGLLSGNGFS